MAEGSGRRLELDRVTKNLLDLLDNTEYELVQENGQRRYTWISPAPRMKGAEIFLGRLPRDCYEDELVPILQRIGRVVELRLMMDFSGSTRGYAFAMFEHPRLARLVCETLNGHEIRPGHRIGVVKSVDNCRLFLGGVPKEKTKADFMVELGKMLDGITNIYLYPSVENKRMNRGFVFVEFKDHRSAAMARRKLIPGRVLLWDHEVAVDWADPEPGDDIDEDIMDTVSALFVRNIPLRTTEAELKQFFQTMTRIPIMKIKKIHHFAFVHYENHELAQQSLIIMTKPNTGIGEDWEITWAKPVKKICDRQRHIQDASEIRSSSTDPVKTPVWTSVRNNKGKRNGDRILRNSIPEVASAGSRRFLDYSRILGIYVRDELQAELHYENYINASNSTYVSKVMIKRGDRMIFQYQGDPSATLEDAVNVTSGHAYMCLCSKLRGPAIGEQSDQ